MNTTKKLSLINKSLNDLRKEFRKSEKSILNEFDAQAILFNILKKYFKKSEGSIHCQCIVDDIKIKPDIMVFENSKFDIEENKKDKYAIKKWRNYILSVMEIKHLLDANSQDVFDKIKSDFNKLKKSTINDSYVILLHHSSNKDNKLKNKIINLTKNDDGLSISIYYCNMKDSYLIKNGKMIS